MRRYRLCHDRLIARLLHASVLISPHLPFVVHPMAWDLDVRVCVPVGRGFDESRGGWKSMGNPSRRCRSTWPRSSSRTTSWTSNGGIIKYVVPRLAPRLDLRYRTPRRSVCLSLGRKRQGNLPYWRCTDRWRISRDRTALGLWRPLS